MVQKQPDKSNKTKQNKINDKTKTTTAKQKRLASHK